MGTDEKRTLAIALDDSTAQGASSAIASLERLQKTFEKLAKAAEATDGTADSIGRLRVAAASGTSVFASGLDRTLAKLAGNTTGTEKLGRALRATFENYGRLFAAEQKFHEGRKKLEDSKAASSLLPKLGESKAFAAVESAVGSLFGKEASDGLRAGAIKLAMAGDKLAPVFSLLQVGGTVLLAAAAALAAVAAGIVVKAIDSAGFKKNTIAGLEALLKSKDAAIDTYAELKKFADLEAPFETKDVAANFKRLLGAGFSSAQTKDILRGAFDLAALNDLSKEVADQVVGAIAKIQGQGKLTSETLEQIITASGGAVSRKGLLDQLAKQTKKGVAALEAELSSGKIKADVGVKAILETIRTGVSGGELGKLSKQLAGESVPGLLSTIKSQFSGMFEDINLSPLTDAMKNVSGVLSGDLGGRLKTAMTGLGSQIFKTLFGPFEGAGGKAKLESFMKTLIRLVEMTTQVFERAAPYVLGFIDLMDALFGGSAPRPDQSGFLKTIRVISDVISELFSGLNAVWGKALQLLFPIDQLFAAFSAGGSLLLSVGNLASSLGTGIVDGIVAGIQGGAGAVIAAITRVLGGGIEAGRGVLQQHSPSRVFAEMGRYSVLGYAQGVNDNSGIAAASGAQIGADAIGGAAGSGGGGAGGGGGGGGGSVVIQVNVTAAPGVSAAEAKAQGEAAGEGAHDAWLRNMRRYNRDRMREAG